jgi:hypothetical protein
LGSIPQKANRQNRKSEKKTTGFVCSVVDVFTPVQIVRDGTTQVLARRFMGQNVTMDALRKLNTEPFIGASH